jgi:hypothetical protein
MTKSENGGMDLTVTSAEDEVSNTIILLDFNGHAWINAAIYKFKNKNRSDKRKIAVSFLITLIFSQEDFQFGK